jgi:hypothetical protein
LEVSGNAGEGAVCAWGAGFTPKQGPEMGQNLACMQSKMKPRNEMAVRVKCIIYMCKMCNAGMREWLRRLSMGGEVSHQNTDPASSTWQLACTQSKMKP